MAPPVENLPEGVPEGTVGLLPTGDPSGGKSAALPLGAGAEEQVLHEGGKQAHCHSVPPAG